MSSDVVLSAVERTFSQADIDRFGAVSGGDGRIHTDPEYAAAHPFGRTVVQGLLLLAVVESALEVAAKAIHRDRLEFTETEVRFVAPVGPGDSLAVEIVTGFDHGVDILGSVDGRPVLVGQARLIRELDSAESTELGGSAS